ncbi:MAG: hypothetical protein V7K27_04945 [Nostoc sp.]|uniref:hypothetical protein n=1 Tax=Nostoc sp. TaxID=1180 RepID=UPI002FF62153
MTAEEAMSATGYAYALVEQLLPQGRLTKVQQIVLRQSWAGQTYSEMAVESDYDAGYIKDVGSELWRSLSQALGEKVTKNNLHRVLKRIAQQQKDTNASLNFQPSTNELHKLGGSN